LGLGNQSYQWLFNANALGGQTNATLPLIPGPNQAGAYSVIVSNAFGAVTSSVATLTLLAPTQLVGSVQMTVLRNFGSSASDGQWPMAGLLQASNGVLWGTTYAGGAYGRGTVFNLNTDDSGYGTRVSFSGMAGDGMRPMAALAQASDGGLYGTASSGGSFGYGTVFRLNDALSAATVIHSFGGSERGDGAESHAGLLQGSDGFLYGTTYSDGVNGYGTIFRLNTNGTNYALRTSFSSVGGGGTHPYANLIQGSDGALYGTTYSGGTYGYGAVFRVDAPAGGAAPQFLHSFSNSAGDGAFPYAGVVQGRDGFLYGTTYSGGMYGDGIVFRLKPDGSAYSVMANFSSTNSGGANPYGGLVQSFDGSLYGTTYSGGSNGYGAVFRIVNPSASSTPQFIYNFRDGNLYGTTSSGGLNGQGAVYRITLDPRILVPPTNRIVAAGSNVTFSVAAAGTQLLRYQWLFNSSALPGQTNSTLILNQVTTNQAGIYSVVIFDSAGALMSPEATLTVIDRPVFSSLAVLPDGNVHLLLSGPAANYRIETSTNLTTWTMHTNVTIQNGAVWVDDLKATNFNRRFYRAVWVP
jgi:uncharacterized repeat protein (TIGR03803 family)